VNRDAESDGTPSTVAGLEPVTSTGSPAGSDPAALVLAAGESGRLAFLSGIDFAKVFLVVGLLWGVTLVFLVPPLQNFDELAHYYRAWSVAEGQLTVPASGTVRVPRSVAALPGEFPYVPIATHVAKPSVSAIHRLLWQPIASEMAPSSSFAASYAPLGYLPQAIGISIARLLGHSPLLSIYLGRLVNLLVSLALVFFALRLLPYGRGLMFVLALFPMAMLQMASLSPDALLIAGTFFFVALVLHYSQKVRLDWRRGITLAVAAALLLNAKPGYAALSLLVFLVPPSRFVARSRYFVTMAATVFATVALAGLIMMSAPDSRQVNALMYGPDNHLNASAQISALVHQPTVAAKVIDTTFAMIGLSLARNAVATYAWGQLNISDTVAVIGWLALVVVFFLREPVPLRAWQRLVLVGTSLLVSAMIVVGFFVEATPAGSPTVLGIQGRYFLPCALVGMLGIFGFPYRRRWLVVLVLLAAVALLIGSSIRTLLVYYY
jgi:hypothetical protein